LKRLTEGAQCSASLSNSLSPPSMPLRFSSSRLPEQRAGSEQQNAAALVTSMPSLLRLQPSRIFS
jgi:hypothetical protein